MWQTNAQTDTTWRHRPHLYIASRGKNHNLTAFVSLIWMAFDLDLICTFKIKLEAESLLQQLWGPKNQSLWNNFCRPQSILTKFECTGQGATAFRNFWVRLAQWGKMGGSDEFRAARFFCHQYRILFCQLYIWWPIFAKFGRNTWMFLHQWIYPLKLHRDACGHERRQNADVVFRDRRSRQFSSPTPEM